VLPEIVNAVGDKITVLFDSGVRTGADIIKAIALGAKAVLVGRPIIFGLSVDGQEGVSHVLRCLLAVSYFNCTLKQLDIPQTTMLIGILASIGA
jgi:lactate 2-monooxygenase